jgi:hypothetical protein
MGADGPGADDEPKAADETRTADEPKAAQTSKPASVRSRLAEVPRAIKQLVGAAVALAAIAGGVAAILPVVDPSGPDASSASLTPATWFEQHITLGQYSLQEQRMGGLRAAGTAPGAGAVLGPYVLADDTVTGSSGGTVTGGGGDTGTVTVPQSSTTSQTSTSTTGTQTGLTSSTAGSVTTPPAGQGSESLGTVGREVVSTLEGHISAAELTLLRQRLTIQDQFVSHPTITAAFKSCEGGIAAGCGAGTLADSARSVLLASAHLGRVASASAAKPIPTALSAGLTAPQRRQVERVLGDAPQFRVDIKGYAGSTLWLEWTLQRRVGGFWQFSSQPAFDARLEAYISPSRQEDEGVLSFWFPIPKPPGRYRVEYWLLRPHGQSEPLATNWTPVFR